MPNHNPVCGGTSYQRLHFPRDLGLGNAKAILHLHSPMNNTWHHSMMGATTGDDAGFVGSGSVCLFTLCDRCQPGAS